MEPPRTSPRKHFNGYTYIGPSDVLEELVRQRHRSGITQKQIAERMGIAAPVVSRLERQRRPPTLHQVQAYARALGGEVQLALFLQ